MANEPGWSWLAEWSLIGPQGPQSPIYELDGVLLMGFSPGQAHHGFSETEE